MLPKYLFFLGAVLSLTLIFHPTVGWGDDTTEGWSPVSQDALERIGAVIENWDTVAGLVEYGGWLRRRSVGRSVSYPSIDSAYRREALRGIPEIQRRRIQDIVEEILILNEDQIPNDERIFWEEMHGLLGQSDPNPDDADTNSDEIVDSIESAGAWGDPHIITGDGLLYDFQLAGEFVAVTDTSHKTDIIQLRLQPVNDYASVVTAVAINIQGDILAWYTRPTARFTLNGKDFVPPIHQTLAQGGQLYTQASQTLLIWPEGQRAIIQASGSYLNVRFQTTDKKTKALSGLWGNFNGNPKDDFISRLGESLPAPTVPPDFSQTSLRKFAESWRISPYTSLFQYFNGESSANFVINDFPKRYFLAQHMDTATRHKAEQICSQAGITQAVLLQTCTLDVGLTDNPEFAQSTLMLLTGFNKLAANLTTASLPTTPDSADIEVCAQLRTCKDCNKNAECGFCDSSQQCIPSRLHQRCEGKSEGWRDSLASCQLCEYQDCKSCVDDAYCGWNSLQQHCVNLDLPIVRANAPAILRYRTQCETP